MYGKTVLEIWVNGKDQKPIGHVNGTLTLEENTADNGGVSLAWDTYRSLMIKEPTADDDDEHGDKKPKLPVEDRIFFVAFAQTSCSKTSDEALKKQLRTSSTSPAEWRVNGVAKNSEDFAKTLRCADNAPMHPNDKCKLY